MLDRLQHHTFSCDRSLPRWLSCSRVWRFPEIILMLSEWKVTWLFLWLLCSSRNLCSISSSLVDVLSGPEPVSVSWSKHEIFSTSFWNRRKRSLVPIYPIPPSSLQSFDNLDSHTAHNKCLLFLFNKCMSLFLGLSVNEGREEMAF